MRVALFITCLTDTFFPRVGAAVVRVLRHYGCTVEFPEAQTCCGQPAYSSGFRDDAAAVARRWLHVFEPYEHIVTPSASCAAMVKLHVAHLFDPGDAAHAAAVRLADRTHEFLAFLTQKLGVRVQEALRWREPTTVHYPCHARQLFSADELCATLRACGPESFAPPKHADLCCGFGGTFAADFSDVSGAMLRDKLAELSATGARTVICNEGGCGLQLMGGASRSGATLRFRHVAECLAESLGLMQERP